MLLAFWNAPLNEDVDTILLKRSTSATGPWSELVTLAARDGYDDWVTHYEDHGAPASAYYRAEYKVEGQVVAASPVKAGVNPYEVFPQHVLDFEQGLPQNQVCAELVQRIIGHAVEWIEKQIHTKLSPTTQTQEVYDYRVFRKIMGPEMGKKILLRHFPVISVDHIYYKVRGGSSSPKELKNLDIMIEGGNGPDGYNRGAISVYPVSTTLSALTSAVALNSYNPQRINILITYQHGFVSWPLGINEAVTKLAAAGAMEIAGEAETAGLSSRSIDGYSESYTASATTTIFSARRIYYEDTVKKIVKAHRKPLWG